MADSGIGIEDTKIIFADFEQLPKTNTSPEGFGLGLAIVKNLVALLGGSVSVESGKDRGSIFTVDFQRVKVISEMQADKSQGLNDTVAFHQANILVVDDNERNRRLLIDYFNDQPVTVYTAANGKVALARIQKTDVAAVLLDLKMPVISGADLLGFMKGDDRYASIPVIIITADMTTESKADALARGCDAYLVKPISKQALFTTLKRFLPHECAGRTRNAEAPLKKSTKNSTLLIPKHFEKDTLRKMTNELKHLKKVKWATLEKTMIFGDICAFATDVREIGHKYELESLTNWGNALHQHATDFDVAKTEFLFHQFDELISRIAQHTL